MDATTGGSTLLNLVQSPLVGRNMLIYANEGYFNICNLVCHLAAGHFLSSVARCGRALMGCEGRNVLLCTYEAYFRSTKLWFILY